MSKVIRWRLVDESGFISKGIEFIENGGRVCHVEFLTDDGLTIGARMDGGVLIRPANYATFTNIFPFSAVVSDEQYHLAWGFLMDQIGKPYDLIADIGVLFHRNWRDDKRWMCSELWTRVMEVGNIIGPVAYDINHITPQHVLLISSAMFSKPQV